jgi:23S rRNA pseudouridine2605 synthase
VQQRIQKVIASAGISSRRRAEELIREGRVLVNGQTAVIGQQVDTEHDSVFVDEIAVSFDEPRLYVALHKPSGYVTSSRSAHGERTVGDLIDLEVRVVPVGRLDRDSSGLLLLTNDGDWANTVTHPRYGIEKHYQVAVAGQLNKSDLDLLRRGMVLPDGTVTRPAKVGMLSGKRNLLSITVTEGRKRQIRLMIHGVGGQVLSLQRVRIGDIKLGNLPCGRWRFLTEGEVDGVRRSSG